jgi:hypothetical protein
MVYTTITAEIAKKCPELSERVGETISKEELAGIVGKYQTVTGPKPVAKPKKKAPASENRQGKPGRLH